MSIYFDAVHALRQLTRSNDKRKRELVKETTDKKEHVRFKIKTFVSKVV